MQFFAEKCQHWLINTQEKKFDSFAILQFFNFKLLTSTLKEREGESIQVKGKSIT